MSFTTAEGRRQLLDELAVATEQIGSALAELGDAYEQLDEQSADRLEEQLFRPVQAAFGAAQRTYATFADRYGLPPLKLPELPGPGRPHEARIKIERSVDLLHGADETISTLQDSMLPVEVGDPEVRAGLSGVRELIAPVPGRAREFVRTMGR
jgi:hypothetical protein